jgi:hypothetical protein
MKCKRGQRINSLRKKAQIQRAKKKLEERPPPFLTELKLGSTKWASKDAHQLVSGQKMHINLTTQNSIVD